MRKLISGTKIVRFSQTRRDLLTAGLVAPVFASGLLDATRAFAQVDAQIAPFTYRASQSALDDLKRRLTNTRWPEKETVDDRSQGVVGWDGQPDDVSLGVGHRAPSHASRVTSPDGLSVRSPR